MDVGGGDVAGGVLRVVPGPLQVHVSEEQRPAGFKGFIT